jgi:hypothetical protein
MFRFIRFGCDATGSLPSAVALGTLKKPVIDIKNGVFMVGAALAIGSIAGCVTSTISEPAPSAIVSDHDQETLPRTPADAGSSSDDGLVASVPSEADLVSLAGGISDPSSVFGSPLRAPTIDVDPSTPLLEEGEVPPAEEVTVEPATAEFVSASGNAAPMESRPDLEKIAAVLREMAAEADDPVPYHLAESMLPLLGVKGLTSSTLGDFEFPEQELDGAEASMLQEVSVFSAAVRTRLDGGEPTRVVLVEELEGLLSRLERGSRLTIAVAELCSEVRGAGDYELLPRVFASGRDQEVLVYLDLNGEHWSEVNGGQWEWAVEWQLELHQIADQSIPHQTDWNRQEIKRAYPVGDNYLLIRYTIPAKDLSSALYMLKIRVREPGTRRETEQSIPFQLVPRSTIDQG